MIDKVIIAEDHESSNLSVQKAMDDLSIADSDYVYYCDDAFSKIQVAMQQGKPYDLLITDLSFDADGTTQKIKDGFDLIRKVREFQPGIMVLVFSGDSSPATIDKLYNNYKADGYVRKARHDVKELKAAFETLSKGGRYYPPELLQLIRQSSIYKFTEFDNGIIRLIAQGRSQKQISAQLNCSLSTIEKNLKKIRDDLDFTKNEQILLYCRDQGII